MHNIHWVTFLLAWIAGYADTATFVAGDSIFSAHVTGNFIVFAAQVVAGANPGDWVKLLTFPVFILAVMAGGRIAKKTDTKYRILFIESLVLLTCSVLALMLPHWPIIEEKAGMHIIVMISVAAMGLQNAFGKLFAKETHGPTTMMTGNVTQASLDLGKILFGGIEKEVISWMSLQKQLITIGGFLAGCLLGALFGKLLGLAALGVAGIALLLCYASGKKAGPTLTISTS